MDITALYTPEEAWNELLRKRAYIDPSAAAWSGRHRELARTAETGSFWKRRGKGKIHVPIAADIATTSADMLCAEPPRFTIYDDSKETSESEQQNRLDAIIRKNGLVQKLHEAAELASVCGDVFLKINYDRDAIDYPLLNVISSNDAVSEWRLGTMVCAHFFTVLSVDKNGYVWRLYERYEKGRVISSVYHGQGSKLGDETPQMLESLGLEPETVLPVDMLPAVQIFNLKPSRTVRRDDAGRSDFEGLRDLMDSLDEAWSSWMRDIRLAKSRLIVPAEFLRKRNGSGPEFREGTYTYEFDEDVETFVALDIATDKEMKITPSQFEIRAEEHARTVEALLRNIVSLAGFSPQSFGLDIQGNAQSGTALRIREKKSYTTRGKKINYMDAPLEQIVTVLLHMDAAIYGGAIHQEDRVKVEFPDLMDSDIQTVASAVAQLHAAQAASIETLIKMQHPEWSARQVKDERKRILLDYGLDAKAITELGDFH